MTWRIAGVNFDHGHMHGLLEHAREHPGAEVVGLCDERRERSMGDVDAAAEACDVPPERVYDDADACIAGTDPDLVCLCPATGEHADWVERVAGHGVHVLLEKPFAASLSDADRCIAATDGTRLAVNWPLAWEPSHRAAKRLIDEGTVGEVLEVHFHDGNSGTPYPGPHPWPAGETAAAYADEPGGWFYDPALGGGSLLDYLGYGTTLATWFRDGEVPTEVNCMTYTPAGLGVDEASATTARYERGLSTFRTRWGTFTDPWDHQPEPECGFSIVGTEGTIASRDYAETLRVQTADDPGGRDVPVDDLAAPDRNPIEHVLHCLENGAPLLDPLAPGTNRAAQRIIETALRSAEAGETLALVG